MNAVISSNLDFEPVNTPPADPMPLLPDIFKIFPNWVSWNSETGSKQPIKCGTASPARSNDPTAWVSYSDAIILAQSAGALKGFGFVVDGCRSADLIAIDIDGCRNPESGQITSWAQLLMDVLGNSYCEVTPSKKGLRLWITGVLPENAKSVFKLALSCGFGSKVQIEVYSDKKYFTMTGDHVASSSKTVLPATPQAIKSFLDTISDLVLKYPAGVTLNASAQTIQKATGAYGVSAQHAVVVEAAPPDPGFKALFDRVGWAPLIGRMNKMADSRFHNLDVKPGFMTVCPMPQHQPRADNLEYSCCFGCIRSKPDLVNCFGCDYSGDLVKTVREFDAGEDGGGVRHVTMYDAARQICLEHNLTFEDFFPESKSYEKSEPTSELQDAYEHTLATQEYEAELDQAYPIIPLKEQPGPTWRDETLYGAAGKLIQKAAQYNEAHPAGMLLDLLVVLGSMFGRNPYFNIGATKHYTNENLARVGDSAYSQKVVGATQSMRQRRQWTNIGLHDGCGRDLAAPKRS